MVNLDEYCRLGKKAILVKLESFRTANLIGIKFYTLLLSPRYCLNVGCHDVHSGQQGLCTAIPIDSVELIDVVQHVPLSRTNAALEYFVRSKVESLKV